MAVSHETPQPPANPQQCDYSVQISSRPYIYKCETTAQYIKEHPQHQPLATTDGFIAIGVAIFSLLVIVIMISWANND